MSNASSSFSSDPLVALREIVARLRAPDGCPWDREQTHASLRGCLLEEAHETLEAIDLGDDAQLCGELGDVLLQVYLHAQIASEEGRFGLEEIAAAIGEKLIRRHPHVFGTSEAADTGAVLAQWEEIKRVERGDGPEASVLDGVSTALPALLYAEKITKRAARVGFDWETSEQVMAKIHEEIAEVEEVLAKGEGNERLEEEIGDLLFAVTNLARKAKVEPEVALRRATTKFSTRFRAIEQIARDEGRPLQERTLEEMDRLWDAVKAGRAS